MEMKNMQYWKRKNALPGLNYESDNKLPSGLAKSSALQAMEAKEGKATAKVKAKPEKLKPKKTTSDQSQPTQPVKSDEAVAYEKASRKRKALQRVKPKVKK